MADQVQVIDLYDLSVLLMYERYTVEPRFRHAMLIDIARGDEELMFSDPATGWDNPKKRAGRIGFTFKIEDIAHDEEERDTPEIMLPLSRIPPRLQMLTPRELKTIFYQARAHDSCFASVALIQYVFAHFGWMDKTLLLRVRLPDGSELVADAAEYLTATYQLAGPKRMVMSVVCFGNMYEVAPGRLALNRVSHIGGEEDTMPHCVLTFSGVDTATQTRRRVMLDLAGIQFGEPGRGLRGGSALFVLEDERRFGERMQRVADIYTGPKFGGPYIPRDQELWLEDVARRVKERYDRRATDHWCGHCGAPVEKLACSKCKAAWYCSRDHQSAAWPHHKHWCGVKN